MSEVVSGVREIVDYVGKSGISKRAKARGLRDSLIDYGLQHLYYSTLGILTASLVAGKITEKKFTDCTVELSRVFEPYLQRMKMLSDKDYIRLLGKDVFESLEKFMKK
jgi:hypothetical protein